MELVSFQVDDQPPTFDALLALQNTMQSSPTFISPLYASILSRCGYWEYVNQKLHHLGETIPLC